MVRAWNEVFCEGMQIVLAANMHERYDHNQGKLESNNNISSRYYITILFIEKLARINSDCCYYFFVNRTPFSLFDCISGYCILYFFLIFLCIFSISPETTLLSGTWWLQSERLHDLKLIEQKPFSSPGAPLFCQMCQLNYFWNNISMRAILNLDAPLTDNSVWKRPIFRLNLIQVLP